MSTTVTMTLDEVREYKPSPEELEQFNKTQTTDFSDCPKLTKEELERFKPWYDLHPDWYDVTVRVKKADVHLKIDVDVLEALKTQGKGYQTRINAILRAAVLGRASPSPTKRETASRLPCNSLPHGKRHIQTPRTRGLWLQSCRHSNSPHLCSNFQNCLVPVFSDQHQ